MAYLTRQLISEAYNLCGVVSQDFQSVSGSQTTNGLAWLNEVIAIKTAKSRLIPYYEMLELTAVIGQEGYFIEQLISIETLTFNIGTIRYSMKEVGRDEYFGTPRADNITSLPYSYHLERKLNGATLFLYYLPAESYPLNLFGKFSLNSVTLDQDLSLTLDTYYILYLKYALSEYISQQYNMTLQPQIQRKLDELEKVIVDVSPMDLTMKKRSTMSGQTSFNYAQANFSPGWTVAGNGLC